MPRYARNLVVALLLLAVLYALDYFVFDPGRRVISPYVARIIMLAGINITLAVSLNLINGFTGQFSIGHAGFMAVGAYSSAYFSINYGAKIAESLGDGLVGWLVALALSTLLGALVAAEAMGVNTTRYKVMAFVISSGLAGAGGVLLAHFDGYLNPKSFEFIKSFEILIMIILGGLGSIVGSIIGAIVLTVLPEALRGFAEYRMVIYSVLLIVLMITRPQGLLGSKDAFKGWRARLRAKTRTEAEEITAEDTRDKTDVDKATLGERARDTSLGEGDK